MRASMLIDRPIMEVVRRGANPGLEAHLEPILRVDLHLEMLVRLDRAMPRFLFGRRISWSF